MRLNPNEYSQELVEHQAKISTLLRVVMNGMTSSEIRYTLRAALQNYHPEYIHYPVNPRDHQRATSQYGSVVWTSLFLAKEGLEIINGQNPGNPKIPYVLTKQHYDSITCIPALAHLQEHPLMKACAEKFQSEPSSQDSLFYVPYESYAPTRLVRDW